MSFIKKHRFAIITVVIFLVLVILALFALKEIFFPNDKESVYGNRLDGISEVSISDKDISKIKKELTDAKFIETVTHTIEGRRLNFVVTVVAKTDLINAKTSGDVIISNLSDEVKTFYDIQLFIKEKNSDKESLYPIIGYKHKTSINFVW